MIEIAITIPAWLATIVYWAFIIACGAFAWAMLGSGAFALWLFASDYSVHKQMKKNQTAPDSDLIETVKERIAHPKIVEVDIDDL